jgi:membrane-associated phospholipid phosphatase
VHDRFHGVAAFVWLTYIPEPLVPLAGFIVAGFMIAVALGRGPGHDGTIVVKCSVSLLVAMAVKDQLKYAFGRTWPETWTSNNPSFIANGVFGFTPFHGGAGWASFPSGHTTAICAVVSVLWVAWPRYRLLFPIPAVLVVVGLLGADFHWLSDTIAGAYLGTAAGVTTALAGTRRGLG